MTAEQIRDLINRDVDGELSPSEHQRLAEALRRNPSARRLHEEINALGASLASMPEVDPPANLGARVRAEVRARAAARPAAQTWRASLVRAVFGSSVLRTGGIFAGGAICGALLFMFLGHPQSSPAVSGEAASGTLLSRSETFPVNLQGTQGMLTAVPTETGKELTFRLNCGTETTTRVTYDPSRVKLDNVNQVETAGGPVVVNEGVVALTGKGMQRCTMTFSGVKDSRVTVQVASTGGGSFQTDVQIH